MVKVTVCYRNRVVTVTVCLFCFVVVVVFVVLLGCEGGGFFCFVSAV